MPKTKLFRPSEIGLRPARLVFAEQPDWLKWNVAALDKKGETRKQTKLLENVEKQEAGRKISDETKEKIREEHTKIDFERLERSGLLYRRDGVGKAFEIQELDDSKRYVHLKVTRAEAIAIAEYVQQHVINKGSIEHALDQLGFGSNKRTIETKKEKIPTAKPYGEFIAKLPPKVRKLDETTDQKRLDITAKLEAIKDPSLYSVESANKLKKLIESLRGSSDLGSWKKFIKDALDFVDSVEKYHGKEKIEESAKKEFAVEDLMKNGGEHKESLKQLYGDVITINAKENLRDPNNFDKKIGKAKPGERFVIVRDGGNHPRLGDKYKYKIVRKIGKNGEPEGDEYKLCVNDGKRVSVGIPEDIKQLFCLDGKKPDLKNREAMRKFRSMSTRQFESWVNQSGLADPEKQKLIAAFKVLDVSYGRVVRGNSLERLAALNTSTKRGGAENVKNLFAEKIGFKSKWNVLYYNFSKEKLGKDPERNKRNKNAVESILRGGTVFMLRVDQETHGRGREAFIDTSDGDAWADNIDAPKYLREKENYIYKYLEVEGGEKEAVLKKYLKQNDVTNDLDQYQVAQVEIPNCENPAIVVKELKEPEKPAEFAGELPSYKPETVPVEKVCGPAVAHLFEDHAGNIFEKEFTKEEKNEKLDSEVIAAQTEKLKDDRIKIVRNPEGVAKIKVVRESEEVVASEVLDIKLKRQLSGGVAQILGRKDHEKEYEYKYEDNEKDLEKWGEKISKKGGEKNEVRFNRYLNEIGAELDAIDRKSYKKTGEYIEARLKAFFEWRKTKLDAIESEKWWSRNSLRTKEKKILRMVEHALKFKIGNFEDLTEKVGRQNEAYELLSYKDKFAETTGDKTLSQFVDKIGWGISKTIAKIFIEKGYLEKTKKGYKVLGENKKVIEVIDEILADLDIAKKPFFVGKGVLIPHAKGDTLSMYRLISRSKETRPGSRFAKKLEKFVEALQGGKWKTWEELTHSYAYKDVFDNPKEFKTFLSFVRTHSSEVCAAHYNLPTGKFQEVYEFFEAVAGQEGGGPECEATGGVDAGGSGPDNL